MNIFSISKRAALIAALFFTPNLFAASTETYRDLIEKAYNLSLQKDRTQAISILLGALKRETRTGAQKELSTALEQVAKVIYSEKVQQLYELGMSLKSTDPATALGKFQEANRLEPENLSIEMESMRLQMGQKDCSAVSAKLKAENEMVKFIEELRLLKAQALVCGGDFDEYRLLKNGQDFKKGPLSAFWQIVEVEYLFKTGAFPKAKEMAQNVQKQAPSYPESSYWLWKLDAELKQSASKSGEKYLALCKGLSIRQFRDYSLDPALCRRTTEVETFLKKNNNSEL